MNYLFLLDQNKAEDFLNIKSKEIFGHKSTIEIKDIKRSKTFNEAEALNVLYSLKVDDYDYQLRVSTSNFLNKSHDYNIMKYLYEHGFNQSPYCIPEPIAFLKEEKILFYKNVDGDILSQFLQDKKLSNDIIENSAKLARKIHSLPNPPFPVFDPKLLFKDFEYELVARKYPKAKNLNKIIEKIRISLPKEEKKLCHGDFNPNNLLVQNKNLCLLDFSMTTIFYKELDLASFITHSRLMLQNDKIEFSKLKKIFLSSYKSFNKHTLYLMMALIDSRLLEISIRFQYSNYDTDFLYECLSDDLKQIGLNLENEA